MGALRKYAAGMPLLLNLAVVYLVLPLISEADNQAWAASSIIIFSFFSLAATLQFGLPALIVRSIASGTPLSTRLRRTAFFNGAITFIICGTFIWTVYPGLWWILLFAPMVFAVGLQRAIWEGSEGFVKSYLARMGLISILPATLAFTLHIPVLAFAIWLVGSAVLYISARHFWALCKAHSEPSQDRVKYTAFLAQSLAAFSFIYVDRYIIGMNRDPLITAIFIRDFEMIYRFTAPMFFIGSLIFPALSSTENGRVRRSLKELRFALFLWVPFSFIVIPGLGHAYAILGLTSSSETFLAWPLLISATVFGLGVATLLQRVIMALASEKTVLITFVITGLTTTVVGATTTMFVGYAAFTLAAKTLVDIVVLGVVAIPYLRYNK